MTVSLPTTQEVFWIPRHTLFYREAGINFIRYKINSQSGNIMITIVVLIVFDNPPINELNKLSWNIWNDTRKISIPYSVNYWYMTVDFCWDYVLWLLPVNYWIKFQNWQLLFFQYPFILKFFNLLISKTVIIIELFSRVSPPTLLYQIN